MTNAQWKDRQSKVYHVDWLHKSDEDLSTPRLNVMAAQTLNDVLPFIRADYWVFVKTVRV